MPDKDDFITDFINDGLDDNLVEEIEDPNKNCNKIHAYLPIDDLKYDSKKMFRYVIGKKTSNYSRSKNIGISKNIKDIFTYSFSDIRKHRTEDLEILSYDTYKLMNQIDKKKYPIDAMYEEMRQNETLLSNEDRKKRSLPTTVQNLALGKRQLPKYLSDEIFSDGMAYWDGPSIYGADSYNQRLEDMNVLRYSYDNEVVPIVLMVYITDRLVKNKIIKVYRLMFDALFKDAEVMFDDGPKTVSLPSKFNECVDYIDENDYRSINYDPTKRNTSERQHGKNIGKTIRRS